MKTNLFKWAAGLLALAALIAMASCGGDGGEGGSKSSNSSRDGKLALSVIWPRRTKVIPIASNSITATLTAGADILGSRLITGTDGPPSSPQVVTFDNLPAGNVTLTAKAYPSPDGSGVAQASGAETVTITPGQTTNVTVTMASTIDHIDITPANPSVNVGSQIQLTATAKDVNNAVVLTLGSYTWASANTGVATVPNVSTASLNATGVSAGTSLITAKLSTVEGGASGTTTLRVTPQGE